MGWRTHFLHMEQTIALILEWEVSVVSQKVTFLFGKKSWKNISKYTGDFSEQSHSVFCTVLISAIIIEIFRRKKNIPISYIIPHKNVASPLIPVCLKTSHMENKINLSQEHRTSLSDDVLTKHKQVSLMLPKQYSFKEWGLTGPGNLPLDK